MKKLLCLLITMLLMVFMPVGAVGAAHDRVNLRVYNWGEYISNGEDGSLDSIAEFEKKYPNIKVQYTTYATNEELYAKLRSGSASYDVILPSDYMVSRMINEDMLEKLDFNNIPNFSDIMPNFKSSTYDPTNEYSVPYSWGTVGIVYNKTKVEEVPSSWNALWDPRYTNMILMFNNSRDAFGIALKKLGFSQNTTDHREIDLAAKELAAQKDVLQAYVMDEIFDKMSSGEAALAPYYAGDALTMIADNPDLGFVVPEEGTNCFVDTMVIPKGVRNKKEAELFINFMMETEIATANIEFLGYSTPQISVYDNLDKEIKDNDILYPSEQVLAKCDTFINLSDKENAYIQESWVDILASGSSSIWELLFLLAVILGLGVSTIVYLQRRKKNA